MYAVLIKRNIFLHQIFLLFSPNLATGIQKNDFPVIWHDLIAMKHFPTVSTGDGPDSSCLFPRLVLSTHFPTLSKERETNISALGVLMGSG